MMILPRKNDIIKHERFMDVAFEIRHIFGPYGPNDKYKVKGNWLNQGFINTYSLRYQQTLIIYRNDFCNWLICDDPNIKCIRNSSWRKIKKD